MRMLLVLALTLAPLALAGCDLPFSAGTGTGTGSDDPDCCAETAPPAETAAAAGPPSRLTFAVGGFLGPTDVYAWDGTTLVLTRTENSGDTEPEVETSVPTPEAWSTFRAELDALDAFSWDSTYFNPEVMDGTQWSLGATYPDGEIASSGSNAFPGSDGPEYSEEFDRLIAAVEALFASGASA